MDQTEKLPRQLLEEWEQALTQFGDVTVLYENEVPVDDTGALWTAYGYEGPDGPHTGILLAFIHDDVGYTVDLDGLETAEQQTINLMSILSDTWLFRPDIVAPRAREWQAFLFDDLAMPVQASYYQQELENGWLRFSVGDGISFLAARTIPLGRDDLSDVVKHWRDVATRGVTDFTMSEDYPFTLNEREWSRTDFVYEREDGMQIQGFILVAEFDDRAVVFWAEMPISRYPSQSAQFLLSVAGLR